MNFTGRKIHMVEWFSIFISWMVWVVIPIMLALFVIISAGTTVAGVLMAAIVNDEEVDCSWENISCQTLELIGIFFTCISQFMHFNIPLPKYQPNAPYTTPIILVPGYHMNRWSLLPLQFYLKRCGYHNIWAINNPILQDDIFEFVEHLHEKIEDYYERCGEQPIMLIGHSMGGLISRHYMQRYGTDKIMGQISCATPYRGTKAYRLGQGLQGRQFKPNSDVCNITEAPDVPHLIIWSTRDWVVVPSINAHLDNSNEMVITDAGHLGMLVSIPVFQRVHKFLDSLRTGDVDLEGKSSHG